MAKDLERHPLSDLDQVACPVLVIGGRDDPLMPPAVLSELVDTLRAQMRCDFSVIDNAGHSPFFDQPEASYSIARAFIVSLDV